jgi:hypothetical protein
MFISKIPSKKIPLIICNRRFLACKSEMEADLKGVYPTFINLVLGESGLDEKSVTMKLYKVTNLVLHG